MEKIFRFLSGAAIEYVNYELHMVETILMNTGTSKMLGWVHSLYGCIHRYCTEKTLMNGKMQ